MHFVVVELILELGHLIALRQIVLAVMLDLFVSKSVEVDSKHLVVVIVVRQQTVLAEKNELLILFYLKFCFQRQTYSSG